MAGWLLIHILKWDVIDSPPTDTPLHILTFVALIGSYNMKRETPLKFSHCLLFTRLECFSRNPDRRSNTFRALINDPLTPNVQKFLQNCDSIVLANKSMQMDFHLDLGSIYLTRLEAVFLLLFSKNKKWVQQNNIHLWKPTCMNVYLISCA